MGASKFFEYHQNFGVFLEQGMYAKYINRLRMKPKRNAVLDKQYRRAVVEILRDRGLSEYALARELGWSQSLTYYRLDRLSRLRLELLKSLAEKLNIDVVDLIKKFEGKNGTENI